MRTVIAETKKGDGQLAATHERHNVKLQSTRQAGHRLVELEMAEHGFKVGDAHRYLLSVLGPELRVPMFEHALCAGFPSPADDFLEDAVDVARLLVTNPPATFLWWVEGDSMRDAGIFDRDILVVDCSLEPPDRDVVVAIFNGERSLKWLRLRGAPRLGFRQQAAPALRSR